MTDSLDARQEAIVDEFAMLDDWMLRYQHLIEHAGQMPPLPDADKTDDRLVRGCQSRVWLRTWAENGAFHAQADSDSALVRGLASLVVRAVDGLPPREVAEGELWFAQRAGLAEHLSPNRANGLDAMMRTVRSAAREAA